MIPAINYAMSALQASGQRFTVHANNVANVNTPGFKSSRALQSTLPGGGTHISSTQRDFSQGALELTGRPTDFAVDGPGFIPLEGNTFTRNGAFSYDANGDLVTADGLLVEMDEVMEFPNPDGLIDVGGSQFALSEFSGETFPSSSSLISGALENSNVDIAKETVGQILAQRNFEFNLVTIKTADEMMGTLLDLFA